MKSTLIIKDDRETQGDMSQFLEARYVVVFPSIQALFLAVFLKLSWLYKLLLKEHLEPDRVLPIRTYRDVAQQCYMVQDS